MADITQAGSTGRRPRGSDTGAAPVGGSTVPAASTLPVAALGTAETAAQAPSEPVVIGAGPVPETPGGPGAGAAQTARPVDGVEARPLTGAAAEDLGLRPTGAAAALSTGAAAALSTGERAELERLRRAHSGAGFVVDAAEVPGRRMARAMTLIRQDGVAYAPDNGNPWVPVDFRAYTELVEIGAISDTPWGRLEDEDDGT